MKKNIIQKLEIIGFKSFKDKTIISFQDDLTAIVGPNGCGKSNILDAIKWVIGERSPNDIRAESMEDLIFSGSKETSPSNFAEVSLTFNNHNKYFFNYDSQNLIKVTRRIERGSGNQYFINNLKVLKKDIDRLFLDTGIGKSSYSFIEQGRIDSIILSKPEKRRILFEEAAKINKFKFEQQNALKNLEKTNGNLRKIEEIQSQIQYEIKKKENQKDKSQYYRQLVEKKKILEEEVYIQKYLRLQEKLEIESIKLNKFLQQKQTNQQKILILKEKKFLLEEQKKDTTQKIHQLEIQHEVSKNLIQGYQEHITQYNSNLNEHQKDNQRLERQINNFQKSKFDLEKEYKAIQIEITKINNIQQKVNNEYQIKYVDLTSLQEELVKKQKELSQKKKEKIIILKKIQDAYLKQKEQISELLKHLKQEKSKSENDYQSIIDIFQRLENELLSYSNIKKLSNLDSTSLKEKIDFWLDNIRIIFKKYSKIYHSIFDKDSIHSQKEQADQKIKNLEEEATKSTSEIESIENFVHKLIDSIQKNHNTIAQISSQKKTTSLKSENLLQIKDRLLNNLFEQKNIIDFLEKEKKDNKLKQKKFFEKNQEQSLNFRIQTKSIQKEELENQQLKKKYKLLNQKLQKEQVYLNELEEKSSILNSHIQENNMIISSNKGSLKIVIQELYNNFSITENIIKKRNSKKNESSSITEKKLIEIKKEIESLGDINLLAKEEVDELNKKFQHNKKQLSDIAMSQKYLKELLEKIEKKSSLIFIEKFNEINQNFHKVFNLLFDGGNANLSLLIPEKPLESGIEIMVSPPGKTNKSIQLLSGGEKTLTAISLMFALYLTNSSPFCVLDEIDAPLDDKNVNKYLKILSSYKKTTQFILITHNQQSMQEADSILGVTMKSPGISTVLKTSLK